MMKTEAIVGIVIAVVIFTALLPTIANSIVGAQAGNVTGAASTLLGLTVLIIVAGFIMFAYKSWGHK